MPMFTDVEAVRERSWHYSFPEVAGCARDDARRAAKLQLGRQGARTYRRPSRSTSWPCACGSYKTTPEGSAFVAIEMGCCA